jgi:hypothetical protein
MTWPAFSARLYLQVYSLLVVRVSLWVNTRIKVGPCRLKRVETIVESAWFRPR